jgi:serine protease Do
VSSQTHKATNAWYAMPAATSAPDANAGNTAKPGEAAHYANMLSQAFHEAAGQVSPAVVMITNTPAVAQKAEKQPSDDDNSDAIPFGFKGSPLGDLSKDPQFRKFFKQLPGMPSPDGPHRGAGAGSGVIVDSSGVILTNNHVVEGGGEVMVRLQDGREFKAVDIKTDPNTDVAILRIEGGGTLPAARLGDSQKVAVGDWVLALGQPFGLEGTVTAGIVSATSRGLGIANRENFIQTDAAINPGNSGGPLVNLEGEVIGINTAISTNSGGYQGVGFAIPVNLAKWVGGQLAEHGKVRRAYLGVIIQPVTQPLADQFKVKVHQGVLVTEVRSDTPAAKAGLKPGDIILKFAGQSVSNPRELQGIVEQAAIGSTQAISILRDGKEMSLNVVCRELPSDVALASKGSKGAEKGETSRFDKLGIQAEDLTPQIAEQLGVKVEHGVAITEVRDDSPAAMAGLATGMVITEANRQPVKTVDDLRNALKAKPLDKGALLLVRSAEGSRYVVIRTDAK